LTFINCFSGKDSWHNWGKPDAEKTTFYGEYGSTGSGANAKDRATWSHQLTKKEAETYTLKEILGARDGWNPLK